MAMQSATSFRFGIGFGFRFERLRSGFELRVPSLREVRTVRQSDVWLRILSLNAIVLTKYASFMTSVRTVCGAIRARWAVVPCEEETKCEMEEK